MIGNIISAGASLIGGLFNRKEKQKANAQSERLMREAWSRDDQFIQRRVADAKAAGIHPLAALGAQGSSSYVTPVATTVGSSIGDAGAAIGRAVDQRQNAGYAKQLQALTLRKMNAEISLLDAQSRTAIASAQRMHRGMEMLPHPRPRYAGMHVAGKKTDHHPGWSDAERMEERYGNLVENLYGMGVLGADVYHNWKWRRGKNNALSKKRRLPPPPDYYGTP